jgi:FeoC like transcriptional regulator
VTVSPLRAVLDAIGGGAGSVAQVSRITGLRADVVTAAVEHLVRMGRLDATPLTTGCPSGGCGSCPSGTAGAPGCGATTARTRGPGPVLVQLRARR